VRGWIAELRSPVRNDASAEPACRWLWRLRADGTSLGKCFDEERDPASSCGPDALRAGLQRRHRAASRRWGALRHSDGRGRDFRGPRSRIEGAERSRDRQLRRAHVRESDLSTFPRRQWCRDREPGGGPEPHRTG